MTATIAKMRKRVNSRDSDATTTEDLYAIYVRKFRSCAFIRCRNLVVRKFYTAGQFSDGVNKRWVNTPIGKMYLFAYTVSWQGVDKNGLAGSKAVPGTSQWVPDQ